MTNTVIAPIPTITAGPVPCAGCGATVDSRATSCWSCGLIFGGGAHHRLWVPLRTPDARGPLAYAAQLLEMLLDYRLIEDARLDGAKGFVVVDDGARREMTPEQVLDEYGDRVADMVTDVMEHSDLTTTDVSVHVGAETGPVPFIEAVEDRAVGYSTYWPSRS